MCVTAQAQQAVTGDGSVNTEQKKRKKTDSKNTRKSVPKTPTLLAQPNFSGNAVENMLTLLLLSRNCEVTSVHQLLC